ncbi:MAG: PAS domain-containing protein [Alphaproteobacteria bacterium]
MSATDLAFRAQLVIPEQKQLFDYWRSKCAGRQMPSRADIRPADLPRLLPGMSLIDVVADSDRLRVRLAGTQLREVFGRDITGSYVEDVDLSVRAAYWATAYQRLKQGLPAQGILPIHQPGGEFATRFWLRLPLGEESGRVNMILGYDACVYAAKLGALAGRLGREAG